MATASNIEALLRTMQADIEVYGSEAVKQRRRTLLRGFRAGLWAAQAGKPKLGEIAQVLRAELFGHPLALVATDDDELCHTGTPTEDE
jgi:dihydroxyacetone kinase